MNPPSTPAELAALLEGLDDATITSWAKGPGIDAVLTPVFTGMAERFLPQKAGTRTATIRYEIAGPESTACWQVRVEGGACGVGKVEEEGAADVTIRIGFADFLRVVTGRLNPVMAFMSGRLKVRGDLVLGQLQSSWFDQRLDAPPPAPQAPPAVAGDAPGQPPAGEG